MSWASLCTDCLWVRWADDDTDCNACGGPVELFASDGEARLRARVLSQLAVTAAACTRPENSHDGASDWLTLDDVARKLGLHRDTVSRMVRDGRLFAINAGSDGKPLYRVPLSALAALVPHQAPHRSCRDQQPCAPVRMRCSPRPSNSFGAGATGRGDRR